jgi:alkylated DNA repair dioxygenase AlkB
MNQMDQADLFGPAYPQGLEYVPHFISDAEECSLLERIRSLSLIEARYREYTAKRRTVSFGSQYDFTDNRLAQSEPIPDFLLPLREKVSAWLAIPADRFAHALVTEYCPGAALGWHRDVPDFDIVVGVSLGAPCRMRFRPYRRSRGKGQTGFDLQLEPRSAYLIRGTARWGWQHAIPHTRALRYSITFRTLRAPQSVNPAS